MKTDVTTVSNLVLDRYLGRWYEIARIDNRFERAVGKAKTTSVPGLLRVSFFWIFYSDYRVLAVDENYNWALVGGSSSKYLWILSRISKLSEEDMALIISEASRRGYDTSRLIYPWK
jgi:apolipoprotein D and lipocalin family protein